MIKQSLVVLALLAGTASAQPGATGEPAPPPNVTGDAAIDAAIAKAQAQAPSLISFGEGALRRARRAIAIGPSVGVWGTAFLEPGDVDAALSFGIGLEKFDVPVLPELDTMQELITERIKGQAKDRVKQALAGRAVDPVQLDQIAAQAYADARKEVLAVEHTQPHTMEKPSFTLAIEANRLIGADRWLGRLRLGVGVWKLTIGASAAFGRVCRGPAGCDDIKVFAGPEVIAHVLTSKNPRSNVVDGFVRFDIQTYGRGDNTTYDQVVVGARFLLDLI